ncbi:Speckle-type POZ protein B [Aphelenchoides fujianensis]|nr:Speckle-type POZ protein B [Aphelenchoides fujianensis]
MSFFHLPCPVCGKSLVSRMAFDYKPENRECKARVQELEAEVAAEKQKSTTLCSENASLKWTNDGLKSSNTALEVKNSALETKVADLESKCARLEEAAKRAAADAQEKLENELLLKDDEIDEWKKSAHKSDETAAELQMELATVRQENEASKQEKKQSAAKIAELTIALEQQEQVSETTAAGKSAVANERDALLSKISELEQRAEESCQLNDHLSAASWTMRGAGYVTDFRLVVDGVEIPVHRLTLALKSAFFFELFPAEPCKTQLTIDGFKQKTVERMVEFCYRGRLPRLEKDAPELYAAARRFQVPDLIAESKRALKAGITTDNAADLLVFAFAHEDHELTAFAVEFANTNVSNVRSLVADSVRRLLPNQPDVYEKIVRMLKDDSTAGGSSDEQSAPLEDGSQLQLALQSTDDEADDRPDSSPSSEFVRTDSQ